MLLLCVSACVQSCTIEATLKLAQLYVHVPLPVSFRKVSLELEGQHECLPSSMSARVFAECKPPFEEAVHVAGDICGVGCAALLYVVGLREGYVPLLGRRAICCQPHRLSSIAFVPRACVPRLLFPEPNVLVKMENGSLYLSYLAFATWFAPWPQPSSTIAR